MLENNWRSVLYANVSLAAENCGYIGLVECYFHLDFELRN